MGFSRQKVASAAALVTFSIGAPLSTRAQTVLYDSPVSQWVQPFLPMIDNNGLVWAPDDLLLYATSMDGTVAALNPDDGSIAWTFQPTGDGTVPFTCNGEVSFDTDGTSVIYAVTEGESCKVYALSHPYGDLLWTSAALEGTCEGTPYYTSDGMNVFVIHNSAGGTVGHFSVLDNTSGPSVVYSFTRGSPFGPFALNRDNFPGGNYGAGAGNQNDLAIWGLKPSLGAMSGEQGSTFAFQMPLPTSLVGPSVTTLLNITSWRHTAPPLLAARGQDLYWFVSRSKVRAWINTRFSLGADAEADFGRGTPAFKAAPYTPVVNDELNPTIMCGGAADETFACLSTTEISAIDNMMQQLWNVSLGQGLIFGDPLMSTNNDRVYWADSAGVVQAADPATGAIAWSETTGVTIEANYELSSDGARLFFADTGGTIVAWEIGEPTLPPVSLPPRGTATPAPVVAPTEAAGSEPPSTTTPTPAGDASSVPTIVDDTSMPSAMPILTAAPVLRPPPTSAAQSLCSSVALATVSCLVAAISLYC